MPPPSITESPMTEIDPSGPGGRDGSSSIDPHVPHRPVDDVRDGRAGRPLIDRDDDRERECERRASRLATAARARRAAVSRPCSRHDPSTLLRSAPYTPSSMTAGTTRTTGGGARLVYQPALDGVRALAVIVVLLFHADVSRGSTAGISVSRCSSPCRGT